MSIVPAAPETVSGDTAAGIQSCAAGLLGTAALTIRGDGRLAAPPAAPGPFYAALTATTAGLDWLLARVRPIVQAAMDRACTCSGETDGMTMVAIPTPADKGDAVAMVVFTSAGVRASVRESLAADLGLAPGALSATAAPSIAPAPHAIRLIEQALRYAHGGRAADDAQRARVMTAATRAILSASDEEGVLHEACESLMDLLRADRATAYCFGPGGWLAQCGVSYTGERLSVEGTLVLTRQQEASLAEGEPVHLAARAMGRRLAFPLMATDPAGAEVEAMILLECEPPAQPLTSAALDVAMLVGRQAALGLRHSRAAALERSLATKLQDMLQSRLDPALLPGHSVATFYRPAAQDALVGGDFFDAFPLPDGRAVVLVGDVAGKGVDAALHTALVRDTLRAYALVTADPGRLLTLTNAALVRWPTFQDFVTLSVAVLDPAVGRLAYAGAGHPSALLYRRTADAIGPLDSTGTMVGVMSGQKWVTVTHRWLPGDSLLLYTDGISEAHSPGDYDLFETARIRGVFQANRRGDPQATLEAVFEAARSFSEGVMHDDCAMLMVTRAA